MAHLRQQRGSRRNGPARVEVAVVWQIVRPGTSMTPLLGVSMRRPGLSTAAAPAEPPPRRQTMQIRPRLAARLPRLALRRSEEHTSALQSRENLVCRLLLE